MWRLIVKNPCDDTEILCNLEGKSVRDLVKQYDEKYNNNFINYYKLDNIKRGRCEKSYPFILLERFTS